MCRILFSLFFAVTCSFIFRNIIDKHYIGDPETIEKKINAVANQGKAKK